MTSGESLTVVFDGDCGFCARSAMVLQVLDRDRRLTFVALQDASAAIPDAPAEEVLAEALHVRDQAGRWTRGAGACLRIASVIPVLMPLAVAGRLPPVHLALDLLYEVMARHRQRLSRLFGLEACRLETSTAPRA